ncbi:MAG: caspase family protein [Deltaproteobacteria bacterium]|nr:caspase family protein [Deltaproteobacteria bacterium]
MRASTRALALALLLLALPAPGAASQRRVAIVVGNNAAPGKIPLRYAERDARRVRQVFEQLGGVHETEVLLGQSAAELRRRLAALAARLRPVAEDVVLFFYYSGHADERALLLGGSRYEFGELRRSLQSFPVRLAVVFIDACQAGHAARPKGAQAVPAVDVRFDDDPKARGRIFITSSTASERSQESDELQASFFTHYLLSGLRGAADDSGDGRVSLDEAYRYAYRLTLERTASTLAGPQHPTYDMSLTGRGQLVLTRLRGRSSHLVLTAARPATIYLSSRPAGVLEAEVHHRGRGPTRIALEPGRYEVWTVRGRHRLAETVEVRAGEGAHLDLAQLRARPLLVATAKGEDAAPPPHLLRASYALSNGFLDDAAALHGVWLGYGYRLGFVTLGGLVAYGGSSYARADGLKVGLHALEASVLAEARYRRLPRVQPLAGLQAGVAWFFQRGERSDGTRESRHSPAFLYRVRLGFESSIAGPFSLSVVGLAGQVVLSKADGLRGPFVGGFEVGVAFHL